MIDLTQFILLFVILVLTIFLFALGIQVFLILKDFKVTLEKLNKILSDAEKITEKVKEPADLISNFTKGIKATFSIADALTNKKHRGEILVELKQEAKEILDKIEDLEDDRKEDKKLLQKSDGQDKQKSYRRFFLRRST